jgi:hypothetical protein
MILPPTENQSHCTCTPLVAQTDMNTRIDEIKLSEILKIAARDLTPLPGTIRRKEIKGEITATADSRNMVLIEKLNISINPSEC